MLGIQELRQRHVGIARELLTGELCDEFIVELDRDCRDIGGILQTVRLVRAASTTIAGSDPASCTATGAHSPA